jgi:cell division protein FtsL
MSSFMQWVTHGVKRGRFEVNRRTALYLFTAIVVLVLVATLYLMLVSRTAARGRRVEQLRAELSWLKKENEQLEVEVAKASAVSRLWSRAVELGFVPADQVEFASLSDDGP